MKNLNEKQTGKVFTPVYLVQNILDLCDYVGESVLGKHVIDNSCGNGAFLTEVVRRYCTAAFNNKRTVHAVKCELQYFIHGIELSSDECEKCRHNLSGVAYEFGLFGVEWDIQCANALTHTTYLAKMDYVVGNPPYVRVHNINNDFDFIKNNFTFMKSGMTDLYLAFYELGIYMLNDNGVLAYITPSSFFNSKAGGVMREYLTRTQAIKVIVDLKHFQPFGATTYSTIVILTKQQNNTVAYYEYCNLQPVKISDLDYSDLYSDDGTYKFTLNKSQKVLSGAATVVKVKNGFTTLLDEFFFADNFSFTEHVIPVVKASTGKTTKCIFPYDNNGILIPFEKLEPSVVKRYDEHKSRLKARDIDKFGAWHGFGRIQGIKDVFTMQYAVNNLVRDEKDIKFSACPPGTGVYGGLYIISELPSDKIEQALISKEFVDYVKSLCKYKSGGYYTFSSVDLQRFLNYKLSKIKLIDF